VIGKYCSANAFVKLSEDDAERLYSYSIDNEQVINDFHQFGAELVCLTLGGDGAIISYNFGKNSFRIYGKAINVVDATGAGDAFWSGFLTAYLDGFSIPHCAEAATKMAILKLGHLGPLPAKVDKSLIY
jgi:sugar/nucleoside kinase (ribokinase family)